MPPSLLPPSEMVSIMAVSPQNITLNPPGPIEMEVSSSVPLGFGRWSVGRFSIFQNDPEGPLAGRVSINQTRFTSKLVISSTTYGDSGVYEFRDVEPEFQLPPVNFFISLPPRDIASEFTVIHSQHWHIFVLHWAGFTDCTCLSVVSCRNILHCLLNCTYTATW